MGLSVRVESIARDVDLFLKEDLSPQARSRIVATFARQQLAEGQDQNRRVLGRVPPHKTFVDGSQGASEDRVKPDGRIVYEFELISEALIWIGAMLVEHSPVKTGHYADSHLLFADGAEVNPSGRGIPSASEYVFLNITPYARKIERGLSPQAPDGVFEAVAAMARGRFGNMAKIGFSFRTPIGGSLVTGHAGNKSDNRTPAIIVTMR